MAISFSAFTFSSNVTQSTKKRNTTDTTSINVSVKVDDATKTDRNLLNQYLSSGTEAHNADVVAKKVYLEEINQINQQALRDTFKTSNYRLREVVNCTGKNKDHLWKEIRADTNCHFWTDIIVIFLFIFFVSDIFSPHKSNIMDWRYQLVKLTVIMIGVFLLNQQLYYILSYLFNHGYLITQEIIKLI